MRKTFDPQLRPDATPIEELAFDRKGRDYIDRLCCAVRAVWNGVETRSNVMGPIQD
ncbi:MAG: hypothetical protein OXE94_14985 [Aestuariivita sp.]|nr:hypothetical protein [Aestuariivita sp.]MCY4202683.1 hypothetical protein [Aestuariivita sp.]MCY4287297.1 hypothetical protein [Aestuariivita sp.]MCY4346530.1 hypothetical protein [Aestuariivita sp.]